MTPEYLSKEDYLNCVGGSYRYSDIISWGQEGIPIDHDGRRKFKENQSTMAQAYIQSITNRDTAYGKMYDIQFSNGDKVGAGKFPPKGVVEGDYVQYEVTMKGQYKNLAPGSLSKISKPEGVAPPAPARSTGGFGGDDRQEIISKQAALNSAIAFLALAQSAEALPVGAKNLAPAKRLDALVSMLNEVTSKFYHQSTGKTLVIPEDAPSLSDAESGDVDWNQE